MGRKDVADVLACDIQNVSHGRCKGDVTVHHAMVDSFVHDATPDPTSVQQRDRRRIKPPRTLRGLPPGAAVTQSCRRLPAPIASTKED